MAYYVDMPAAAQDILVMSRLWVNMLCICFMTLAFAVVGIPMLFYGFDPTVCEDGWCV